MKDLGVLKIDCKSVIGVLDGEEILKCLKSTLIITNEYDNIETFDGDEYIPTNISWKVYLDGNITLSMPELELIEKRRPMSIKIIDVLNNEYEGNGYYNFDHLLGTEELNKWNKK